MLSTFVLVGGPFVIRDTAFDEGDDHLFNCVLGGKFELDEEIAHKAIVHGAALLPAETFDAIGFTPEELKQFPNAKRQTEAPKDHPIHAKLLAARIAVHDLRAQLAPPPQEA